MKTTPALKLAPEDGQAVSDPGRRERRPVRHRVIRAAFVLVVVLPTLLSAGYLYLRAADQYHSVASFSVRSEDFANPLDALSAFTQVGASSASDSQILYDFIRSQPLVEEVDGSVDLRAIYRRAPSDFVFSLGPDPSVEDLIDQWERMVRVSIDTNSGVLDLEVRAFAPEDARRVAEEVLRLSADLVEDLSRVAREDAMRFAREDVTEAETRLREMRRLVRLFRSENQIIDPEADVTSQMGVIAALETALAEALVERRTLLGYTGEQDLRVVNLDRQIEAIRDQIEDERDRVGETGGAGRTLSEVIADYEELLVDLEFSQNAYTAALAAEEQARAEARRKSRYLAVHIPPTVAEESLYPQRALLTGLVFVCAFAVWATGVLIYYNVRDRS